MKRIFNNFTSNPRNDIFSGLTVALALVPEAVAFSFVAGPSWKKEPVELIRS